MDVKDAVKEFLDILGSTDATMNTDSFHPIKLRSENFYVAKRISTILEALEDRETSKETIKELLDIIKHKDTDFSSVRIMLSKRMETVLEVFEEYIKD